MLPTQTLQQPSQLGHLQAMFGRKLDDSWHIERWFGICGSMRRRWLSGAALSVVPSFIILAKLGWRDVVLLERDELTSGSTWHAAANIHGLHDNNNITRIQHYTMNLYKQLEAETGQGCGVFQPGSLYLAQTEEREHQLRLQEAKAKFYGLGFYEISREQALELHPLAQFDDVRCIMFEPDGGNVDPSGVTHAYAAGARMLGAEIERFCPVIGTEAQPDGSWIVPHREG
jgi:dimethylglycine dehydrogenase